MASRPDVFLQVALEMGVLSAERETQARQWIAAAAEAGWVLDLPATLVQRGWLTPEQLTDVQLEVRSGKTDFRPAPETANVTLLDFTASAPPAVPTPTPPDRTEHTAATAADTSGPVAVTAFDADALAPSDFVAKYDLGEPIGAGGVGEVRLALDRQLGRPVAIKTLLQPDHPTHRYRFLREAQITGQLEHPNIVPIHELGRRPNGQLFFAMKLVRGRTLDELLNDARRSEAARLDMSRLLDIFSKICDAVAYAHFRGVIHRDLKPQNVMIGEFGEVLVMDWGLAVRMGAADPPTATPTASASPLPASHAEALLPIAVTATRPGSLNDSRTLDGTVIGTPAYMSPEQARGEIAELDVRTDIYSLGAILYEMLTLTPPFSGQNLMAILLQVEQGNLVPPNVRLRERPIPAPLEAAVMKAMARHPVDRYESVTAFQDDMRRTLISGRLQEEFKSSKPIESLALATSLSINRTSRVILLRMQAALKEWEMLPSQYNVLRMLKGAGEAGLSRPEIDERMVSFDPYLHLSLEAMVARGWCTTIEPSEGERRWAILPAGDSVVDASTIYITQLAPSTLGGLSELELRQLNALLGELRDNIPHRPLQ